MANYTIISDIGNAMVKMFKTEMVPDIIANADAVGLCSPAEKENMSLGIYLYDIKQSEAVRVNGMISGGRSKQKFPPVYLDLYYMITAYSMSDSKFKASEEQRILGRVIQLLKDHPTVDIRKVTFDGSSSDEEIASVELLTMDTDEKVKLWNSPNAPYRLSLFYKISPVPIDSTRAVDISRVKSLDFSVSEQGGQ